MLFVLNLIVSPDHEGDLGRLRSPHPSRKELPTADGGQCRNTDPSMAKLPQFFKTSHISRLFEVKKSVVFAAWQLILMFKKETPCDPNKHICRADLMGLVCVSLKFLCVTHTITPASFSLSRHLHPPPWSFQGLWSLGKTYKKATHFEGI